jgi:hypothetical protein
MLQTVIPMMMMISAGSPASLTTQQIVDRMLRADKDRVAALAGYTGVRKYHFENKRVNKRAEMTVRMKCDNAGVKTFTIVDESGPGVIRNRILRKMIEAEAEASQKGEREQTLIIPANYDFNLVGTESSEGRSSYVLEISPKTKNKFLIRGRIWVDSDDFAITRVEGQPAKNPSFWIHRVDVAQRYSRVGRFWLPVMNESKADARIFGSTDVSIEYFDYVPTVREAQAHGAYVEGWTR